MVVFLDMDGVMIPAKSWKQPEILHDGFPAFSPKAVTALNSIIQEDTRIILTTSHRHRFTISQWKNIFKLRCIEVNQIDRLSENRNFLNRKEEILDYFNTQPTIIDYLIIDDDKSLNDLPHPIKQHVIQPSATVGLVPDLITKPVL